MRFRAKVYISRVSGLKFTAPVELFANLFINNSLIIGYIVATTDRNFSLDDEGGVVPGGVGVMRLRQSSRLELRL
jgi:hypothetical protein